MGVLGKVQSKHKQLKPNFEHVLPNPFSAPVTITPIHTSLIKIFFFSVTNSLFLAEF